MKNALAHETEADPPSRLTARFAALKEKGQKALVTFITGGDPDLDTCAALLRGLPGAGADIIEISVPFSDPMADGPIIQEANIRAFKAGVTLKKVLAMVAAFRCNDTLTPIVLMGYFNPVFVYGTEKFIRDAKAAGVDGVILVDVPPEEDAEFCLPAKAAGLHFIRLLTPTTDAHRLPTVLKNAGGFLYYVSVAGITGTKAALAEPVQKALAAIRRSSTLPIAVGFGISTPEQAKTFAHHADGVIVGSAIVKTIAEHLDADGRPRPDLVKKVLSFVADLANATHSG